MVARRIRRLTVGSTLLTLAVLLALFTSPGHSLAPLGATPADLQVQQEEGVTQEDARFPLVTLILEPGWNLVGWMGASSAADATASIVGEFQALFAYDAPLQQFEFFGGPSSPAFLNTLDELPFGAGVWIFALEESLWIQPSPWWARSVELQPGFNLSMWTGPNNTPIDEALAGLGPALIAASTYDAVGQSFLSFGPDRPAFLNSAEVLNYGDGVWLEVREAVTWEQPALQRIGTQDVSFVRRIARIDETGAEVDITDEVLAVAEADLGPPIALQFGLTFREARSMNGRVTAENGVELPSITVTSGVVSRDASAPDDAAADLFLGDAERVFVVFTSAHLERAFYNVDLNDLSELDFSGVESVSPGDQLTLDSMFVQTLERAGPLAEDGLTELEIFARRWNAGDLQIFAVQSEDGELFAFVVPGLEGSVGTAEFSAAELQVADAKTAVKWTAKTVGTAVTVGLAIFLAPESFGVSLLIGVGVLTFIAGSSAAVASNIDDLFPPDPSPAVSTGGTTVTGKTITIEPDGTIIVENGTVTIVPSPSTPPPPPPPPPPPAVPATTPTADEAEELSGLTPAEQTAVLRLLLGVGEKSVQNVVAFGETFTFFPMGPMYPGVLRRRATFTGSVVGADGTLIAGATVTGTITSPDGATTPVSGVSGTDGGVTLEGTSASIGTFVLTIDSITCPDGGGVVESGATHSVTVE